MNDEGWKTTEGAFYNHAAIWLSRVKPCYFQFGYSTYHTVENSISSSEQKVAICRSVAGRFSTLFVYYLLLPLRRAWAL